MHVTELNENEMYELKEVLYYNVEGEQYFLTKEQRKRVEDALRVEDVPDEIVHKFYDNVEFTKEDFLCNA